MNKQTMIYGALMFMGLVGVFWLTRSRGEKEMVKEGLQEATSHLKDLHHRHEPKK